MLTKKKTEEKENSNSQTNKMRAEVLKVLKNPENGKEKAKVDKKEQLSEKKEPAKDEGLKKREGKPLLLKSSEPKKITPPPPPPTKKKKVFLILIIVVFFVLLALVVFGVGLYRYNWSNSYVDKVTRVLPYPAAVIDYKILRYDNYQEDYNTLRYYFNNQAQNNSLFETPEPDQIKEIVLEKMINDEIIRRLAEKNGITVTEEEVDEELIKIKDYGTDEAQIEEILNEYYGWDIAKYKDKVLAPYLLAYKLQDKISADQNLNTEFYKKAQDILAKVKAQEKSFEELAEEYSEDYFSSSQGGDLGFLGRGDSTPQFESAAFNLNEGEISDIVQDINGYHIIKLEQKLNNDGEQIKVRHILIRTKGLDILIEEEKNNIRIYKLVN